MRCQRRAGALAGARADQYHVLDHRRLFRLAFAACPRRGQLVRAGLSGVRHRGGRRRQSGAMEAARAAHADFCLRWALPIGHRDVCAADRAGQYRRALGLSPRRHGAQRRRRLARARPPRSRRCARAWRAPACSRRTTAPPAGWCSICRRAPASRSRTSASAGSTCPSRIRRCLPASCSMSTRLARAITPLKSCLRTSRRSREVAAQARAARHRDLRARSARRRQGRRVRPLPSAGTGVRDERAGSIR